MCKRVGERLTGSHNVPAPRRDAWSVALSDAAVASMRASIQFRVLASPA